MVFNLINSGIFGKTDEDSIEDFKNVFDFQEAFVKPFAPEKKVPAPKKFAGAQNCMIGKAPRVALVCAIAFSMVNLKAVERPQSKQTPAAPNKNGEKSDRDHISAELREGNSFCRTD
jgi:hypothetical protein